MYNNSNNKNINPSSGIRIIKIKNKKKVEKAENIVENSPRIPFHINPKKNEEIKKKQMLMFLLIYPLEV